MSYRDELVVLIANGTPPAAMYAYLSDKLHLSRPAIIVLLKDNGVTIRLPESKDDISDSRRRELQELSLS
jgi:hypothetical protein